jgi:Cu-Zn family superoxide dismutase
MTVRILVLSAAAAVAVVAGCATPPPAPSGMAMLAPTAGNTATGHIMFTTVPNGVRVTGDVQGLKPGAVHGFHIHEKGDCGSPDAMSAGGHFNPGGAPHGEHGHAPHHAGDLPSLTADAGGAARIDVVTGAISVGGGPNDILGRGLIVHRDPDDYKTQPTGNSGPRLACAVITKA